MLDLKDLVKQRLGLLVLALAALQVGQMAHGRQGFAALWTQHAAADLHGLAVNCLGPRVLASAPYTKARFCILVSVSRFSVPKTRRLGSKLVLINASASEALPCLIATRPKPSRVRRVLGFSGPRTRRCNSRARSSCLRAAGYCPRSSYVWPIVSRKWRPLPPVAVRTCLQS